MLAPGDKVRLVLCGACPTGGDDCRVRPHDKSKDDKPPLPSPGMSIFLRLGVMMPSSIWSRS